METSQVNAHMKSIDSSWQHNQQDQLIFRSLKFKNFSQTMDFINALAQLADQQGHHPDVKFGYNYCEVSFTTHEAGGVTLNDFICAKMVDGLV